MPLLIFKKPVHQANVVYDKGITECSLVVVFEGNVCLCLGGVGV